MDIFEMAAWATIGSFGLAVLGVVLKVWRLCRKEKKR